MTVVISTPSRGLSPLTRGNLGFSRFTSGVDGPIPAHAGEPHRLGYQPIRKRAYPRSRGGTSMVADASAPLNGLSPLTRGNPVPALHIVAVLGPIPAHAGEPN